MRFYKSVVYAVVILSMTIIITAVCFLVLWRNIITENDYFCMDRYNYMFNIKELSSDKIEEISKEENCVCLYMQEQYDDISVVSTTYSRRKLDDIIDEGRIFDRASTGKQECIIGEDIYNRGYDIGDMYCLEWGTYTIVGVTYDDKLSETIIIDLYSHANSYYDYILCCDRQESIQRVTDLIGSNNIITDKEISCYSDSYKQQMIILTAMYIFMCIFLLFINRFYIKFNSHEIYIRGILGESSIKICILYYTEYFLGWIISSFIACVMIFLLKSNNYIPNDMKGYIFGNKAYFIFISISIIQLPILLKKRVIL